MTSVPSIATIQTRLGVPASTARTIRIIMQGTGPETTERTLSPRTALQHIGVELDIIGREQYGTEWMDDLSDDRRAAAYYLSVGDAYAPTVLYDCARGAWSVTSYGDWVERYERTGRGRIA